MNRPPHSSANSGSERRAYGPDPSQFGELHLPTGTPRGVVVVIHGGFWRSPYDYGLGSPLAVSIADNGWAAWNIEYRRVGNGGGNPATFDDVSSAIDSLADTDLDLSTVVAAFGRWSSGYLVGVEAPRPSVGGRRRRDARDFAGRCARSRRR